MEPAFSLKVGNFIIAGGLVIAALGLAMWESAGHTSGLGFVVAASGCFLKNDSLAKLGTSTKQSLKFCGIFLFTLGLAIFPLRIAGR